MEQLFQTKSKKKLVKLSLSSEKFGIAFNFFTSLTAMVLVNQKSIATVAAPKFQKWGGGTEGKGKC